MTGFCARDTRPDGSRCRATDESGQAMLLTAVMIGMLLVVVGLVVDVGHAMLVQRQLQAGVDSAALAGAQDLPAIDPVTGIYVAETTALAYSPTPGSRNAVNTVGNATTTVRVRCIASIPGCSARRSNVNSITVQSQSHVPTWFGKIIGISRMTVNATATACSPCTAKPLDIMIVLDRTGSMCYDTGTCQKLTDAKEGVETFLEYLDPSLDKVGLALFPPALDQSHIADCPAVPRNGAADKFWGYDAFWPNYPPDWPPNPGNPPNTWPTPSFYVVASLEGADGVLNDDYLVKDTDPASATFGQWKVNHLTSAFVQRLDCAGAAGSTSYSLSMEEAQHELADHGRPGVQKVIIFLSDGAANTSPMTLPTLHWTNNPTNQQHPCATGVESASRIKGAGGPGSTVIYTIGYGLELATGAPEQCRRPDPGTGHNNGSTGPEAGSAFCPGTPPGNTCNAYTAIRAMATDPDGAGPQSPLYYDKPDGGDLNNIFSQIATDVLQRSARLVEDTLPDAVP